MVTAPLGAWAIPTFAPKLLEQGEVDPTKVSLSRHIVLLAAIDTSPLAEQVLIKAADLARRCDGDVVVLHVLRIETPQSIEWLKKLAKQHLADIRHQFITTSGAIPTEILQVAQEYSAAEIIIGKRGHRHLENLFVGSVSRAVVEISPLPVVIVEAT